MAMAEPDTEWINLDQFLTNNHKQNHLDPWNQVSALDNDCLLIVEFGEKVGPKPILMIPQSPGAHFDADDFAVWLMTADYQQCNTGTFNLAHDIGILLHNEEQGIHTYAHHFMLYDIQARGYQRPFCMAYLTRESHLLAHILPSLKVRLDQVVGALKRCNRKLFIREISAAIDTLNSIENQAISSYYEIYYENNNDSSMSSTPVMSTTTTTAAIPSGNNSSFSQSTPLSQTPHHLRSPKTKKTNHHAVGGIGGDSHRMKTEKLHLKTRRVYRDLCKIHGVIRKEIKRTTSRIRGYPDCTAHPINMDPWTRKILEDVTCSDILRELSQLSPCIYGDAEKDLRYIWSRFRRENSLDELLVEARGWSGPSVDINFFSMVSLPPAQGSVQQLNVEEGEDQELILKERIRDGRDGEGGEESAILTTLIPHLPQLLFPLLTGQFLLVAGSDLRRSTCQSLIHKFRRFLPTSSAESSGASSVVCKRWHKGRVPPTSFVDFKLFGLRLGGKEELGQLVAGNILPFLSILNLNSDTFHSSPYRGRILHALSLKNPALFKSDSSLIPYVYSILSDYGMLAYVLYYFVYSNHQVYRKNVKFLKQFAEILNLDSGDMKIIRYFVEILKQQQMDSTRLQGTFESLFLEHEPSVSIKL